MGVFLLIAMIFSLLGAEAAFAAESADLTLTEVVTTSTEAANPPSEATPPTTDTEAVTEPIDGIIADFFREESAGILSGVTLLFTLIVSLGFRKKVIPSLLEALATLIGKSREAVGAITAGHEAEHAELTALLSRVEQMLSEARTATAAAEEAAANLLTDGRLKAEIQTALSEQSDLLYELLMSANLPQYQKDRIGAQHAKFKAALTVDSHE